MIRHSEKILACLGILGVVGLAHDAKAMTTGECEQLSENMYLAAIERGECDISIETAAGPQVEDGLLPEEDGNRNREGRNGGEGGGGGDGGGGGSRDSSGGSRGTPGKP